MELEIFRKLPLGGVDRRRMVTSLAERGPGVARTLLSAQRARIRPADTRIAKDSVVLILGGSNGITRALALQLLFGEGASVYAVHLDSEKMQIGPHHVRALAEAAEKEGLYFRARNDDATKPEVVAEVVSELKARFRAVHLVNGIAAGATKRYVEHGTTRTRDLDVAFDPVLQVPDFSSMESVRRVGLVDVDVATEADIERTNRLMGNSSRLWAEALGGAGLLARGESVVAFCDYDFEKDDPVYGLGPLAGAKILQRESMKEIHDKFGVKTARICYPPVATTALGAIPSGLAMYAISAEILLERGAFQDVLDLAAASMAVYRPGYEGEDLRLDAVYQEILPEFHRRMDALFQHNLHASLRRLVEHTRRENEALGLAPSGGGATEAALPGQA